MTFQSDKSAQLSARAYSLRMLGFSFPGIGREIGVSRSVAYGRSMRQCERIEEDNRDLEICAALDAGHSLKSIAEAHGVKLSHVRALAEVLS